jgi:hypothetical protein
VAVAAQIALADVIAPENQNVGLAVGHRDAQEFNLMLKMPAAVGYLVSTALRTLMWRRVPTSA